jgi:hypothetical protein
MAVSFLSRLAGLFRRHRAPAIRVAPSRFRKPPIASLAAFVVPPGKRVPTDLI